MSHCILALLLLKVAQGGMSLFLLHERGPCCPQLGGKGVLMPGSPAGWGQGSRLCNIALLLVNILSLVGEPI